jgi:hypothetical protein
MKLFIPPLRTKIKLLEPWTFRQKRMNIDWSLNIYLYGENPWWEGQEVQPEYEDVTIPAGTILSIDRIYIRTTKKDYDSITFRIHKTKDKPACRFWAPLAEANKIECEVVE